MRKIIAGGITALVASGVLLAGASTATAASAREPNAQQDVTATNYEYYTWYWTQSNCESAGAALQVRGVISNYYCQESAYTTWYLYVAYR